MSTKETQYPWLLLVCEHGARGFLWKESGSVKKACDHQGRI